MNQLKLRIAHNHVNLLSNKGDLFYIREYIRLCTDAKSYWQFGVNADSSATKGLKTISVRNREQV
jgi:hypothetical protein